MSARNGISLWLVPVCVTTLIVTMIAGWAHLATGGETPYPLDDTFIHLAMAKNLASGHWGVTAHAFSNASSSPLYVALLAAFGKIGIPWLWIPLALNLVAGICLLIIGSRVLISEEVSPKPVWICLGALIALLPLPYIIVFGMEHTLHCAVMLAFLAAAISCIQGGSGTAAIVIAPFLILLRLESAFLIALAILCLLRAKRYREAGLMGALTALPILALGLYSRANGESLLPNPIILKAGMAAAPLWMVPFQYLQKIPLQLISAPSLLFLFGLLVYVADTALKQSRNWLDSRVLWPMAAMLAIGGHVAFANVGWLYRYEMYLIAIGIVALAISTPRAKAWILIVALVPCAYRAYDCARILPAAIVELNAQQVQLGHFIHDRYDSDSVALHDIGSVSFYSDARVLDLAGLASREILHKRLNGTLSTDDLDRLATSEGTRIAAVYDSWFQGNGDVRQFWTGPKLPPSWIKVGEWKFAESTVIAGEAISFYATSPVYQEHLRIALQSYAPRLSRCIELRLTPQPISSVSLPGQASQ